MRKIFSIILGCLLITGIFPPAVTMAFNTPVTEVEVYLQDYVVARPVRYELRFKVGHTLAGGTDTITIKFPEEIEISSDITAENVSVNNYTPGGIDYNNGVLSVLVPRAVNILNGETVEVAIASGVINNPKAAGSYSLSVYTSQDTLITPSRLFSITDYEYSDGVSKPSVRVGIVSDDSAPEYKINFKTSVNGALRPGDQIYLNFPSGTVMPSSIDRSEIQINGTELYYAPVINGRKLTLLVPSLNIAGGAAVEIVISAEADINRPSDSTQNVIKVSSSVETREINSFAWEVASGSIDGTVATTGLSVVATPNGQLLAAGYTITVNAGLLRALDSSISNLVLAFPPGTTLPADIATDKITVNGKAAAACMVDKHINAVVVSFQDTYSSETQIIISINKTAGIINPRSSQNKMDIGMLRTSGTVLTDWYTIYEVTTAGIDTTTTPPATTTTTTTTGTTSGRQQIELRVDSTLAYADGVLRVLDAAPAIINNITMVPLRFVAEYMGATTTYDSTTSSVTIKLGTKEIILWVGSGMAKVNGAFVSMNAEAVNINNRLMVPVRFVSENLGAQVSWDGTTRLITIVKAGQTGTTTAGNAGTTTTTSVVNAKVYVKSGNSYVNLRSGPDTTYQQVGKLYPGEAATIIEDGLSWYKVRLASGLEAWIADWLVEIK